MLSLKSIVIVDSDIVDESNTLRQDFFSSDCGRHKVDVLAERPSIFEQIVAVHEKNSGSERLLNLVDEHEINLLIQAADGPSSGAISRMLEEVSNQRGIPYIVNSGYLGGTVTFPEFYYSNRSYSYSSYHKSWEGDLPFSFQKEKIPYRVCSELGSLVAQQVIDYESYAVPTGYGEKGYFDMETYTWNRESHPHAG